MSGLLGARNSNEAQGMEQLDGLGSLGAGLAEAMLGDELPSKGAWTTGMILSFLLALASVFGIVATFLKGKMALIAAGSIGLLAILLMILQPSLDGGPFGGVNPKNIAIITGLLCLVGAGSLFGVHKANQATA